MTLYIHEMRKGRRSLIIWSAVIAFMLGVCVLIYPEMSGEMQNMGDMFANMGSFSDAFGLDQLNFGEFMGYFGIECGNVLGLGGALFAAIIGISALSKEESSHTAELLLTHPISRARVFLQKLLAVISQVVVLNLCVAAVTSVCILAIGVEVDVGKIILVLLAYLLMQLQVAVMTFGISAFISNGGLGIGLGLSLGLYIVNILSNLTDGLEFVKYLTPFGYTDSAYIISHNGIEMKYLATGMVIGAVIAAMGYYHYKKKDIT